ALAYGDIAFRYALNELNPFAIVGADYSQYNEIGQLDVYDEQTGVGTLTRAWIADRARMLAVLLASNTMDDPQPADAVGQAYVDIAFDIRIAGPIATQDLQNQKRFIFGSEEGDGDVDGGSG